MKRKNETKKKPTLSVSKGRELPPFIPDGIYEAVCYKVDIGISFGRRQSLFAHFRVVGSAFHDTSLHMVCTLYEPMSHRSKLYKLLSLFMGMPLMPGAKIDTGVLRGKLCTIRTRTVTTDEYGEDRPECLWYSVVDAVLSVETGTPVSS